MQQFSLPINLQVETLYHQLKCKLFYPIMVSIFFPSLVFFVSIETERCVKWGGGYSLKLDSLNLKSTISIFFLLHEQQFSSFRNQYRKQFFSYLHSTQSEYFQAPLVIIRNMLVQFFNLDGRYWTNAILYFVYGGFLYPHLSE